MRAAIAVMVLVLAGCATPELPTVDLVGPTKACLVDGGLPVRVRIDRDGNVVGVLCARVVPERES
jgi:hypothetical protein